MPLLEEGLPAGVANRATTHGAAGPLAESAPLFAVIVPCYNEQRGLEQSLADLDRILAELGPHELICVDDGSTDGTGEMLDLAAQRMSGLKVVRHETNRGYGAALKSGLRRATAEIIVITDADGTYPADRIPDLLALAEDADMVVGERSAPDAAQPWLRRLPKWFLNRYISYLARRQVVDMNSGLRLFRKSHAQRFWNLLPQGFSFTTTMTMALLTNGYEVRFVPISYAPRLGSSKIRPIRDTLGFIQLIVRMGMYFAPLRVLLPLAGLISAAAAAALIYDVFVLANLTDKSILLAVFALQTVLFALIADMIDKRLGR